VEQYIRQLHPGWFRYHKEIWRNRAGPYHLKATGKPDGWILPLQSELKKGTTFTTIIPFEEAKMQEEIRKSSVIDNKSRQTAEYPESAAGGR